MRIRKCSHADQNSTTASVGEEARLVIVVRGRVSIPLLLTPFPPSHLSRHATYLRVFYVRGPCPDIGAEIFTPQPPKPPLMKLSFSHTDSVSPRLLHPSPPLSPKLPFPQASITSFRFFFLAPQFNNYQLVLPGTGTALHLLHLQPPPH